MPVYGSANEVACLNCGSLCSAQENYCNQCGASLSLAERGADHPNPAHPEETSPDTIAYEISAAVSSDEKLDGFFVKDWISYIKTNIGYYLYCFKLHDSTGYNLTFTWSAMLCPSAYFLYRRVWWAAFASLGCSVVFSIPLMVSMYLLPYGITFGLSTAFWSNAATICSAVSTGINFLWGINAVRFYRQSALKRMTALRESCASDAEFSVRLQEIGGPSYVSVLLLLAPYVLLVSVIVLLIVTLH